MEKFLACLHVEKVCRDKEDRMLWIETKCDKFTVKSHYNTLELDSSMSFPMKGIRNLWV